MKIKKKKEFLLLFCLSLALLIIPILTQVQAEVDYPDLPGADEPTDLPTYIKYIYVFLITFSGVIALGVLIWGGIIWLTSGDDPSKVEEARSRIFSGLAGIIILLSVYLILYSVNPDLTNINVAQPPSSPPIQIVVEPGFYICSNNCPKQPIENLKLCLKNEILDKNCERITGTYTGNLNNDDFNIYLVPSRPHEAKHYLFMADNQTQEAQEKRAPTYENCAIIAEKLISNNDKVGSITDYTSSIRHITAGEYYEPWGRDIVYLENEGNLPGPKFCEYRNCIEKNDCQEDAGIWGEGPNYDYKITKTQMAISFSDIIPLVREMSFNEIKIDGENVTPDYAVILWKEQKFTGECYFSPMGEKKPLDDFVHKTTGIKELTCPDGSIKTDTQSQYPWTQIGSMVALPLGGPRIASADPASDEEEIRIRNELGSAGITINKGCVDFTKTYEEIKGGGGQTCVRGLPQIAIDGLIALRQACGCEVVVTGGTELGHQAHGIGKPVVDLRTGSGSDLDRWFYSCGDVSCSFCSTPGKSCNCQCNFGNYNLILLRHIGTADHWHVEFR